MKINHLVKIIVIVIAIILVFLFIDFENPSNTDELKSEILASGLDTPWAIDALPDGRLIFTERPGRVNILDDGEVRIIEKINTTEISESGLLGIAVAPDYEENHHIYLYYHDGESNRVSNFKLEKDPYKLKNETILLDNIPSARFHNGGRIKFGPDGKLYVTTGDATKSSSSQDINSVAGKILRLNKNGSIPEDNPYDNHVYSFGHRNPQGLAWHPQTKKLFSSEHGPNRNDEINIIKKGKDYGWPNKCIDQVNTTEPIRCYTRFTLAPSGIAFYENDLFVSGLRGTQLRRLKLKDDEIINEEIILDGIGRIREVFEYNDSVYISTSNRDGRGNPRSDDDKIIVLKQSSFE